MEIWRLNWLSILSSKVRLPVVSLGCIQLNSWPRGALEIPKQPILMLKQRVAFCKLTVASHYRGQYYIKSLNMQVLRWSYMDPLPLHPSIFIVFFSDSMYAQVQVVIFLINFMLVLSRFVYLVTS